jgi:hypothetical protein
LLVVAADDACARWAAKPINIGGGASITPIVLPPSGVPAITDEAVAIADPELAVLSAMAHGMDADIGKVVSIANAAQQASRHLDVDRSRLYVDLIHLSISEAARRALCAVDMSKYEYQSDFAKQYIAVGRTEGIEIGRSEGLMQGRAGLITQLLAVRFGVLSEAVRAKIAAASLDELDSIGERLLTARTLEEALG